MKELDASTEIGIMAITTGVVLLGLWSWCFFPSFLAQDHYIVQVAKTANLNPLFTLHEHHYSQAPGLSQP